MFGGIVIGAWLIVSSNLAIPYESMKDCEAAKIQLRNISGYCISGDINTGSKQDSYGK